MSANYTHLVEVTGRLGRATPQAAILVESWNRSRAAGLLREARPTFHRVVDGELEERRRANGAMIAAAAPHLRWLVGWFHDRPAVAYLTDADGIVLHSEGDAEAITRFHLSPGYDWSEARMGTNGAGTALAAGRPVAVVGCDHWSVHWKDATCLGAPVVARDGSIAGAIDISCDAREGDAERLVVAAHIAYTISQELARRELEQEVDRESARLEILRAALDAAQRARADAEDAEAQVRVSEQRLQTIINSTPALIYVVDAENRFQLINRRFADLFGIDPSAAAGRSIYDYFDKEVADQFARNNRDVLQGGSVHESEETVPTAGAPRTYISMKAPILDETGQPAAVCGVSTDITDRKQLVAALQAADRQRNAFIATVAHELRQPLGAIQAALGVLRLARSADSGERARAVIARQVAQLTRLVEDLLDASRITQGKVSLRRERTILNDVLRGAIHVAQPLIGERQQKLDVEVPDSPMWVDADAARLQQVFSNLLVNAAKFTGRGGRIAVSARQDDGGILVTVSDTGAGIAAEMLPHIFDLFAQARSEAGGLGIGLAVVRALVERHGGTVEARSAGPGQGSQFVVRLPALQMASNTSQQPG